MGPDRGSDETHGDGTRPHLNFKPGEGVFVDKFKLMSVYGNVALATDRRIRKIADANGKIVSTPHRALLVFVKENGQWKIAAGCGRPGDDVGVGMVELEQAWLPVRFGGCKCKRVWTKPHRLKPVPLEG